MLAPAALAKYLAYKGSITINGEPDCQRRARLTARMRSLHQPDPAYGRTHCAKAFVCGQRRQPEVDTVARYVERMLSVTKNDSRSYKPTSYDD